MTLTKLSKQYQHWRGSAAELAAQCSALLPDIGLSADASSLSERLVRYYVTEGILTPPRREGRDAVFHYRQLIELLVTRYLLGDGWPLKKIAAIVDGKDLAALQDLIPGKRPPTAAEEALARIRGTASQPNSAPAALEILDAAPRFSRKPVANALPPVGADGQPGAPMEPALDMAAASTRRKTALRENLKALGNNAGAPKRRRVISLALTDWCDVQIDAKELQGLSDHSIETLGAALIQALQMERSKKGDSQ